jgi:hypothetical protein
MNKTFDILLVNTSSTTDLMIDHEIFLKQFKPKFYSLMGNENNESKSFKVERIIIKRKIEYEALEYQKGIL